MSIGSDVNDIIALLTERGTTKPGVMSAAGEAAEKRCAAELRVYFRKVTAQLRGALIGLHKSATPDLAKHTATMVAARILRRGSGELSDILKRNLTSAMLKADKQEVMHEAKKSKKDGADVQTDSTDQVGLSGQEAADWASENAAQTVTGINQTTTQRFADAVSQAVEDQLGVSGLSQLLRGLSDDMTKARADTIATTEIGNAFGEAALRKLKRDEIEYKQLIPSPDACPVCLGIVADGPIPVDDPFVDDEGDEYDRSPIHPKCRCATVGARAPEDDNSSEE